MSTRVGSTPNRSKTPRPRAPSTPRSCAEFDHQPRLPPLLDGDEAREIAEIAVHAVQPFRDNEHALVAVADRFQQRIERVEVVVGERAALGLRQLRAHDDAVVGERIVDDEVARAEEGADRRNVGGVPADERQACLLAVVAGERRLERPMDGALAGDQPARRSGDPVAVDRLARGGPNGGMTIESQIIVGGEVEHSPAVDDGGRASVAFMQQEVGIPETHRRSSRTQEPLLGVALETVEGERARVVHRRDRALLARLGRNRGGAQPFSHERVQKPAVGFGQTAMIPVHRHAPQNLRDLIVAMERMSRAARRLSENLCNYARSAPGAGLARGGRRCYEAARKRTVSSFLRAGGWP